MQVESYRHSHGRPGLRAAANLMPCRDRPGIARAWSSMKK